MPSSVFHAYDIRGLAPQEIDVAFATHLGYAIVDAFAPKSVLVGRDMRTTSADLESALVEALVVSGVNVVRIGLCSTPLFNVSVGLAGGGVDIGVMVTASHNPGKYNGFKLVRGDVSPIGQGDGMEQLKAAFEAVNVSMRPTDHIRGSILDEKDALGRYLSKILHTAELPPSMPSARIAIDAGNGMGGFVLPALLQRLPWLDVLPLYFDPDGSFPNHEANPLKRETLADLSAAVVREKCAFGVAFDGDADRIGFVDENGEPVPGDLMLALLSEELLRTAGGGTILYDLRSSWIVPETIFRLGGTPKMCRVGHSFIKRQMREEGALFAGEVSMHYYFRDLFNVESGDLVLLLLLRLLARAKKKLSELWRPLLCYAHSGEMNFQTQDPAAVLRRLRAAYGPSASALLDIDGLRMEFRDAQQPTQDWWFSVRMSNTEPLLRLNLETRSPDELERRKQEIGGFIQG